MSKDHRSKSPKPPKFPKQPKPKLLPLVGPTELSSAIFWNDANRQLYYVDILKNEVHRFDPKNDEHRIAKVGDFPDETVSFVIPECNSADKFVIGFNANLMEITWDGVADRIVEKKVIHTVDPTPGVRVSCAVVTPKGGLFIGTQGPTNKSGKIEEKKASLFQYAAEGCTPIVTGLTFLSGMTFSGCGKTLFFVDSESNLVEKFVHKLETDELTNRQLVVDFTKNKLEGKPYGVVCDIDESLWITTYGGKMIIRVDIKTNTILLRVPFEAVHITSLCFAGSFLREMYATTGRFQVDNSVLINYPSSGYLFRVTNLESTRGFPCRAFCVKK